MCVSAGVSGDQKGDIGLKNCEKLWTLGSVRDFPPKEQAE